MDFPNADAVKTWIITNQLIRRNLTDEQRAYFRGLLAQAGKKPKGRKKNWSQNDTNSDESTDEIGRSAEKVAKMTGVSKATVDRDKKFAEVVERIGGVSPEAKNKILAGKAHSVAKGKLTKLAQAPEEEIKKVAQAIVEDKPLLPPTPQKPDNSPQGMSIPPKFAAIAIETFAAGKLERLINEALLGVCLGSERKQRVYDYYANPKTGKPKMADFAKFIKEQFGTSYSSVL